MNFGLRFAALFALTFQVLNVLNIRLQGKGYNERPKTYLKLAWSLYVISSFRLDSYTTVF